jgi:hypothetical protein
VSESIKRVFLSPRSRSLILGFLWFLLAIIIALTQLIDRPSIEINWKTASEFDTAGFNIYRSDRPGNGFQQINDELIHALADISVGAEYSFVDDDVVRGTTYYYRLEDVEYDSSTTQHEIVSGRSEIIDNWAIVLVLICTLIGITFLIHAIRSKPTKTE